MGKTVHGRFWKTIICTPLFLAASLVCGAVLVSSRPFEVVRDYVLFGTVGAGYLDEFLDHELHVNMPYVILPAVMGIPYLGFLSEETAGRKYRDALIRSGRDRYVARHIFSAAASGMVLAGAALLLSLLFSAAVVAEKGLPVRLVGDASVMGYAMFYQGLAENGMEWACPAVECLMFLCYGAVWPVVGVAAVFWTQNRYVAASVPFLVSAVLESAAERFSFEWVRPSNLLGTEWLLSKAYGGIPCTAALLLTVCGICWVLVRFRLDKIDGGISA